MPTVPGGPVIRVPRTSPTRLRDDRWGWLAASGAVVGIAAYLVHEIYSLDVWWQVAVGRDILGSWSIPRVDRYAAAALGRPYHDSHWLFQAVLALAHRPLGMFGVQLVLVGLWSATLATCWSAARRWVSPLTASLLVLLAGLACVERFLPRPEIVTFLGIAVFWHVLQAEDHRRPRSLVTLVLTQVVWANSHGLFVIGPFMVGCYGLSDLVRRLRGRQSDPRASALALACVLGASLVTPFPLGGWRYAWQLFVEAGRAAPVLFQAVGELRGTFDAATRSAPAFWLYLVLLALAVGLSAVSIRTRGLSPRLLAFAGLAAASLSGRRNMALLAVASVPYLAELLGRWARCRGRAAPLAAVAVAVLALAAAAWPLSGAFYLRMEWPTRFGIGVTPSFFPHGLPAFLERHGYDGQVLNSNTLGGFYLYHSFPERLPLTDGRWEVYDPGELEDLLVRSRDGRAWPSLIPAYGIDGLLLAHTSLEARAILPTLRHALPWRLVYLDRAASFWMREGAERLPPALDLRDPQTLPSISRPDDGLILDEFFASTGAVELRMANLERTLGYGARTATLLGRLGMLQIETGRLDQAEATFEALLREDPRSVDALNELAFLAYNRGDTRRSADLLERALGLEPENQELRQNYERILDSLGRGVPDGR